MNIRAMQAADILRVMEIAAALPEAPRWPENAYNRALDPTAIPARIALVADHPSAGIVGFLVAALIPPQAELETIAVPQIVRQRGLGASLLTELFTLLKKLQITEVMLEVRESNQAARAFYASAGFQESARRSGYYSDPKEDAVLLARRLP